MNKIFSFCLLAALVFSCKKKDDAESGNPCVGAVETPEFLVKCFDDRGVPETLCAVEFTGDFELNEYSKTFQHQYCEPIGTTIRYKNEKGEIREMTIIKKMYQKSNAIYNSAVRCPEDSTKFVGYCIDFERLDIWIKSDQGNLDITLSVHTKPDLRNPGPDRVGDFLEISRKLENKLVSVVSFVIDKRTLSYEEEPLQVHLDKIELMGRVFEDVITNDVSLFPNPKLFKYYINAAAGLIGFVDSDGVLWVIEE